MKMQTRTSQRQADVFVWIKHALIACLVLACAHARAQDLERVTSFTYHLSTGQLLTETVDPGGSQCVETAYELDAYGNRQKVTTRPCAGATSVGANFTPRVTLNEFAAVSGNAQGFNHPAGAYVTRSRSGTEASPGGTFRPMTESRASFDTRFGAALTATQVALGVPGGTRDVVKRTLYDALGRVASEYTPAQRDPNTNLVTENRTDFATVYCQGPLATADAGCINIQGQSVVVNYTSGRLSDNSGQSTGTASILLRTAYFVQATPRNSTGAISGAISRVHYDSLHREIAKETQTYDGKWVRTLTGYDNLGMTAVSWTAHVVVQANDTPPDELRQWTGERDLMHRPTAGKQYARTSAGSAAVVVENRLEYNGLMSTAVTPAGSSSDGIERRRTTYKNAVGQTQQTVDPYGATLNMAYDGFGNLTRTKDALGNQTAITYTAGTARFKTGMQDPDRGNWSYSYDALGQLIAQTDGNGKTVNISYDALGRVLTKGPTTQIATWIHSVRDDGQVMCAAGLPATCQSWTGNAPNVNGGPTTSTQYVFDELGRVLQTNVGLDRVYNSTVVLDELGRTSTLKYPTGLTLRYVYSNGTVPAGKVPGFLVSVEDANNAARKFWSITGVTNPFDDRGRLVRATLGNGVSTDHVLDSISGKSFQLRAGNLGSNNNVLNQAYTYDLANNLTSRSNGFNGGTETFGYDLLDRLIRYTVDSPDNAQDRTVTTAYNAIGNILSKSDLGVYYYNPSRPHATIWAAGTSYTYDGNGNLRTATGGQTRTQTWTDFNLPDTLAAGGNSVSFQYDERFQRVKETIVAGSTTRRLWAVHPDNAGGLFFEREEALTGGVMTRNENRHYISVGGAVVGVVKTINSNSAGAMDASAAVATDANLTQYWHKDHLGSIVAVSNGVGTVTERPGFDAWGRRLLESRAIDTSPSGPAHGDRGYTGHEHLDEIGLVHMNGRVYDPVLARFLSPDPVIATPNDLQSYNLYSYVQNNPLKFTDPSGHCIWDYCVVEIAAFIVGSEMARKGNQYWRIVGTVMMMWAGQGITEAGLGEAATGWYDQGINAFNSGQIGNAMVSAGMATAGAGGSGDQIVLSMIMAAGYYGAGEVGAAGYPGQQMAIHMLMGCAGSQVSGGQCGPGAMAAAAAHMTSGVGARLGPIGNGIATIVVGGTVSVIGGGKFSNGATSAAMGYLFNELLHQGPGTARERLARSGYVGAADEGVGDVIWKTNYPNTIPVDGAAGEALQCTARCVGRDLYGTGGKEQWKDGIVGGDLLHSPNSAHYDNQAVDFRGLSVQSSKVLSCSVNCGFRAGWWENWGQPHWHFQLNPSPSGRPPMITTDPLVKR